MPSKIALIPLSAAALLLAGCGIAPHDITHTAPSAALSGHVIGGQQPVSGAKISIFFPDTTYYGGPGSFVDVTTSDANGNFQVPSGAYTCPSGPTPIVIVASGGNPGLAVPNPANPPGNPNLVLAAALGECDIAYAVEVNINEVSTVVTAFALSHFFNPTLGGDYTTDSFGGPATSNGQGNNFGLLLANDFTVPNLIDLASGTVQPSTSTMTIESAKIYSLANSLAACVNTPGLTGPGDTTSSCGKLFADTTPPGATTAPADTLQAAVQIALYPWQHISDIYDLAGAQPPFAGLGQAPNDWTIGVSYTAPQFGLGINTTSTSGTNSNLDIDTNNIVWFPSNNSANPGIAYLDPGGPAFEGPYGSGLLHPQYVAVTDNYVYATDLAAAQLAQVSDVNPFYSPVTIATTGFTGALAALYDQSNANDLIFYTAGGSAGTTPSTLYSEESNTPTLIGGYMAPPNAIAAYPVTGSSGTIGIDAATSGVTTPAPTRASSAR